MVVSEGPTSRENNGPEPLKPAKASSLHIVGLLVVIRGRNQRAQVTS